MGWTTAEVKSYVLAQLGFPKRRIELDDNNLAQALRRALRYYASKKPVLKKGQVTILSGQQSYNFTTLALPYGKGIVTVYPEPITSPGAAFDVFEYWRIRSPSYIDLGELVAEQMYYKDTRYLTGTDFDWEWIQDQTILLVTPIPNRTYKLAYDYNHSPTTVNDVPDVDQGWVVDYTLALVKEMLGRVRNKFQGVPGNDLPVQTDGSDLLSEAQQMQQELKEGLWASRGDWTPPIKG